MVTGILGTSPHPERGRGGNSQTYQQWRKEGSARPIAECCQGGKSVATHQKQPSTGWGWLLAPMPSSFLPHGPWVGQPASLSGGSIYPNPTPAGGNLGSGCGASSWATLSL